MPVCPQAHVLGSTSTDLSRLSPRSGLCSSTRSSTRSTVGRGIEYALCIHYNQLLLPIVVLTGCGSCCSNMSTVGVPSRDLLVLTLFRRWLRACGEIETELLGDRGRMWHVGERRIVTNDAWLVWCSMYCVQQWVRQQRTARWRGKAGEARVTLL